MAAGFLLEKAAAGVMQKAEVLDGDTDQSFLNAVAVMPLFARSVAAELREASDQVGEPTLAAVWLGTHLRHWEMCLSPSAVSCSLPIMKLVCVAHIKFAVRGVCSSRQFPSILDTMQAS